MWVATPHGRFRRDGTREVPALVQEATEKMKDRPGEPANVVRDEEMRHLGEPADVVRDEDLKWATFVSHHQADASYQVLYLGERIEKELKQQGKRLTGVWVDKKQKATVEGMHEGVRRSQHFILFLTKEVLTREFCLNEIRMALKYRKNVILVFQTDARSGGVPGPFFDYYGPELKKAFPHADDYGWLMRNSYVPFQDRGSLVDVMLSDPQCGNGILDQMSLDLAATHAAEVRDHRTALPTRATHLLRCHMFAARPHA